MATHMRANAESRIRQSMRARKFTQGRRSVLCVLGVIVVLGVVTTLMQSVLAAKSKERVLDCHVTTTVAHHHSSACYDEHGDLVCTLPERDLHTHSKACYDKKLTCTLPEGEGHKHDSSCYDENGNLTCGLEESEAHAHTDACYTEELVCGMEECTEEHVHSDACFRTIASDDDADQTAEPADSFSEELTDAKDKPVVTIDVTAPEGALPKGTTMQAKLVDTDDIDKDVLQKAVDTKAAKVESLEAGRVLDFKAVDITFKDAEGTSIEPKKDVTVKLTSDLAKSEDETVVMHLADKKKGETERTAEVVDTLSEKQAVRQGITLGKGQLAFDASEFSTYVLATATKSGELSVEQTNAKITMNAPAEAGIPASASLQVTEIVKSDEDYDGYLDRSAEATEFDRNEVGLARFFDISIIDEDGKEIQPAKPVDMRIEIEDVPAKIEDFKLVHFAEDADGNENETPDEVKAGGENGATTFTAESFSVYGVIYTVDFGYEVGDKTYEFSIKGGESISMEDVADKLHLYENVDKVDNAKQFAEAIDKVEFSNPDLMWVGKVEGKKIALDIEQENDFLPEYAEDVTDAEWKELVNREYEDEWVLISRKPFSTVETLTITMKDGSEIHVKVTDAVPHKKDSQGHRTEYVETIANPGVTTIDLFDYWVDNEGRQYRETWPGFQGGYNFKQYRNGREVGNTWNQQWDTLRGGGHWGGINWNGQYSGGNDWGNNTGSHPLKFVPGADHTVWDNEGRQNIDKNAGDTSDNGDINSYTGSAKPTQGLVANRLDDKGYPVLSGRRGGNTESLAYLFNHNDVTSGGSDRVLGKRAYPDVNHFLYVDDENGYYTFDSNKVQAMYDNNTRTFVERDMPTNGISNEDKGFWPFGLGNWHLGMHVQTEFIQPEGGQVPNKQGTATNDMTFFFGGDDDAWVFIDGVLVGDGGGIHNGTVIDINFAKGDVKVTAQDDQKNHKNGFERTSTLRQLFADAGVSGNFDGETFAAGGHHTFDFFYLERGGSESNILLKYNLLATTDFQAKKKYVSEDGSNAAQDQFQFSLIGVDGRFNKAGQVTEPNERAIMPNAPDLGWKDPANKIPNGSSNNPSLMHLDGHVIDTGVPDPNNPGQDIMMPLDLQVYTTGNLAGMNGEAPVLFGEAIIPQEVRAAYDANPSDPPRYRYMVIEQVPPEAINAEGKAWKDCNAQERKKAGFYKGTVLYDATVYYMECVVDKKQVDGGEEYYLKRIFYKNAYFDEPLDNQDVELEFTNKYVKPLQLVITKTNNKTGDDIEYLQGAEFEVTYGQKVSDNPVKYQPPSTSAGVKVTTDANGKANLPALPPGTYLLRETKAPQGYKECDTIWLLDYQEVDTPAPHTEPVITELNADGTMPANPKKVTPQTTDAEITLSNGKKIQGKTADLTITNEQNAQFKFKVQKQWDGIEGTSDALKQSSVKVKLGRYMVGAKKGTINVKKTGVPHDAKVTIFYTITRVYEDYTTEYVTAWSNQDWPESGVYQVSVPVDVPDTGFATYMVTERVYSDDPNYVATHNAGIVNPQYKNVSAAASVDYEFTADYQANKGHLFLKTTLDKGGYDVDTSGVQYTLFDGNGNAVHTWSYAEVTGAGYDATMGYDLGEYLTGDYRVVESGWPVVADAEVDHEPAPEANGTVVCDVRVPQGGNGTAEFETTYHAKTPCDVEVYFYKKGDTADPAVARTFTVYGSRAQVEFQGIPGANTDYTDTTRDKTTDYTIAGNGMMGTQYDIQWDAYQDGTAQTRGTIDVDLPQRAHGATTRGPVKVYIGTDAADTSDYDVTGCTEIAAAGLQSAGTKNGKSVQPSGADAKSDKAASSDTKADKANGSDATSGKGEASDTKADKANGSDAKTEQASSTEKVSKDKLQGNKLMAGGGEVVSLAAKSGAAKLGANIAAGHVAIPAGADQDDSLYMLWDGQGRPQAPTGKSYVDDSEFNDLGYTITLTQNDADTTVTAATWTKEVQDDVNLPALDENGNAYVYYIMGVQELEMPKGTQCTIVKDGDKQLVTKYIDDKTEPTTLAVSNKVGQPVDVELIKVDKNDPTKTLAGAKFHVEMQNEDTQQWERLKGATAPTVEAIGTGAAVTVDSNGVFEVPQAGVVVKELEPGTYRFIEDACPAGYIMNGSEFAFTVEQDGTITSAYKAEDTDDCITLNIPNTPGSELPHAGGIGTILFTVVGAVMMAAGALMLARKRCFEA